MSIWRTIHYDASMRPPLDGENLHQELQRSADQGVPAACQIGEAAVHGHVYYSGDCRGCRAAAMTNAVNDPYCVVQSSRGDELMLAAVRRMIDRHGEDGERLFLERELARRGLAIA